MRQRLANSENPSLLQSNIFTTTSSDPVSSPRSIPLFLVHDGGGTTFSYACLEPLSGRTVYGIHNPRFDEGGFWEGGIEQMARMYVAMIEKAMGGEGGDVLLGGWSLGGSLSLEMSHQIASSPSSKLRVAGMIWVDTVYPLSVPGETCSTYVGPNERITEGASEAAIDAMTNKELTGLNMAHARRMVCDWDMPRWMGGLDVGGGGKAARPPSTILLRAEEWGGEGSGFVDRTRQFRMLGWESYDAENGGFIREVVDVAGAHFTVFGFDKIETISVQIRDAADQLEIWHQQAKR